MTVDQLIEHLTELAMDGHGDKEVMLATQPGYPLAHTLKGVVKMEGGDDEDVDEWHDLDVVWLVEGGARLEDPYAPRQLWENVRS